MKVCHLITSLGSGGAERNLTKLVNNSGGYENTIISLKKNNFYSSAIKKKTKIYFLNLDYDLSIFFQIFKIIKILKKEKPDKIMTWMYHPIFLSVFIKLFYKCEIFWNIRHSNFDVKFTKFKTILLVLFCSLFSHFIPKKIVFNSEASKRFHFKCFYSKKKAILIYNGFNNFYSKKKNNPNFVISFIGRNNPQKNHKVFFEALSVLPKNLNFKFLLIGKNIPRLKKKYNPNFEKKFVSRIKYFDERKDIYKFYKIIDLNILPSIYGESFSNVVAESMCYGIPNIVSNVGDNKKIVKNSGLVLYDWSSKKELSLKILKMYKLWKIKKKWNILTSRSVDRIRSKFSLKITIKKYHKLFYLKK